MRGKDILWKAKMKWPETAARQCLNRGSVTCNVDFPKGLQPEEAPRARGKRVFGALIHNLA